jgi:hypothetical protein
VLARLQVHPAKRIEELQPLDLEARAAKKKPRSRFAAVAALSTCLRSSPDRCVSVGCQRFAGALRLTSFGYYFPPAATRLIADLQSSLRLARADLIQDNFAVRRCASAQRCFTSFVHAFFAAAVAVKKF